MNSSKTSNGTSSNASDNFPLNEVTIIELQEMMRSGKYTSEQITLMYLKRIEEIDKNGPALNSVIEVNPDAVAIAKTLDAERKVNPHRLSNDGRRDDRRLRHVVATGVGSTGAAQWV